MPVCILLIIFIIRYLYINPKGQHLEAPVSTNDIGEANGFEANMAAVRQHGNGCEANIFVVIKKLDMVKIPFPL